MITSHFSETEPKDTGVRIEGNRLTHSKTRANTCSHSFQCMNYFLAQIPTCGTNITIVIIWSEIHLFNFHGHSMMPLILPFSLIHTLLRHAYDPQCSYATPF